MARRSKRCVFIKRWQNIYKHHDVQRRCWIDVGHSGVKGQWQLHGRFVVFVPTLHVEFIQHSSLKKNKGPLNLGSAYWGEKCSFFFLPNISVSAWQLLEGPPLLSGIPGTVLGLYLLMQSTAPGLRVANPRGRWISMDVHCWHGEQKGVLFLLWRTYAYQNICIYIL